MARALPCKYLACNLDHLDDGGWIACVVVVRPTKTLRESQQYGLHLASGKHGCATLGIHSLECGRVDGDRSIEQLSQLGRWSCIKIRQVDGKVPGIWTVPSTSSALVIFSSSLRTNLA